MTNRRIFLTGAAGYIGSRLVQHLMSLGHEVVGLDRAPQSGDLTSYIQSDLLNPENYSKALSGCDLIFHLAAAKGDWGISRDEYHRDNFLATQCLLETATKLNKHSWFFYSTVSVLGPSTVPLGETSPFAYDNDYGWSKAICEELINEYISKYPSASVTTIRPSVVYGPDNPWNTNIYRLVESIYNHRFIMIGDGKNVKTTSYIENLLAFNLFLLKESANAPGHHVYHYVDSPQLTTGELVSTIYKLLDRSGPKLRLPLALAAPIASIADVVGNMLKIDFPITGARVSKFCRATNFGADAALAAGFQQPVSNSEALKRTIDWHVAQLSTRE